MPSGYLESLVDVVDRERDAVHTNLVGASGFGLDRFRMDVLEELKTTLTVRCLEHGDVGMVAVKTDSRIGPALPFEKLRHSKVLADCLLQQITSVHSTHRSGNPSGRQTVQEVAQDFRLVAGIDIHPD